MLVAVARRLGALTDEVAFCGGQVVSLLLTDPAADRTRPTYDVDIVISTTGRSGFAEFEEILRSLGFRNDTREGSPICRWLTPEGIPVDFMPASGEVLGFSNRWYPEVLATSKPLKIAPDLFVRIPPAPLFLATKWEAYFSRGALDPLASHDLEDIIALVAGRPEIVRETEETHAELRRWITEATEAFLEDTSASYAIPGALGDASRLPGFVDSVEQRFRALSALE